MRKKKENTFSNAEVFRMNWRAYRLIYKRCPKMIVSRLLCVVWEALTPYVGIVLSARIIDELSAERNVRTLIFLVALALLSAAMISLVAAFLYKWRDTEGSGLYYRVQQIFSEKMAEMDFADADDPEVHKLYSTIEQNRNGGGWGLHQVYGQIEGLLAAVLRFAGGIVLTVSLFTSQVPSDAGAYTILNHPLFILLIAAVMILVTWLSPALSTKAGSYYAKNASSHNLGNRLFSFFGWLGERGECAADVRIYRQDRICDRYNNDKTSTFCSKGIFAKLAKGPMGLYGAASSVASVIFTGIVYAFVCLKALGGAFGIGAVTQYIASITTVSGSVSAFLGTLGGMRNNTPFLKLTFDFLDIPGKMQSGTRIPAERPEESYIEFRDVSFRYPGSENYVLRHVNLRLRLGKRFAVVGQNGSGKTTFIKLLCRLYDPTEGVILLNGIDIREYDYQAYLSFFSVVFQDFGLLAHKLGENVAVRVAYEKERVTDCLQKAGFGERLAEMPAGTDTYLYKSISKDGIDVSGGEAQKIAIARALHKDVPFIILDEPTAALDPIAESEIYSKFDEIAGEKTAVYISHRLSSCRFCDEIAVFHDGMLVQQGTHDALVADDTGKYHALWYAQAQYYAEAKNESI